MHRVPASGVHGNPSVHVVLDVCALQEDCGWLRDLAIPASVRALPAASSCARQPFRYFMCSAPVDLSSISLELPNKRLSWHPLEIDSSSLGDVWELFFFFIDFISFQECSTGEQSVASFASQVCRERWPITTGNYPRFGTQIEPSSGLVRNFQTHSLIQSLHPPSPCFDLQFMIRNILELDFYVNFINGSNKSTCIWKTHLSAKNFKEEFVKTKHFYQFATFLHLTHFWRNSSQIFS